MGEFKPHFFKWMIKKHIDGSSVLSHFWLPKLAGWSGATPIYWVRDGSPRGVSTKWDTLKDGKHDAPIFKCWWLEDSLWQVNPEVQYGSKDGSNWWGRIPPGWRMEKTPLLSTYFWTQRSSFWTPKLPFWLFDSWKLHGKLPLSLKTALKHRTLWRSR